MAEATANPAFGGIHRLTTPAGTVSCMHARQLASYMSLNELQLLHSSQLSAALLWHVVSIATTAMMHAIIYVACYVCQ
jgi:hypothetical protein